MKSFSLEFQAACLYMAQKRDNTFYASWAQAPESVKDIYRNRARNASTRTR